MADKKKSKDQAAGGGNPKSSGKGGGHSVSSGAKADPVGNLRTRGADPSPDDRKRGQTAQR